MDFKSAKEIVLALKEIAKNIQGDKSNNNNDDLQYSVLINPQNDGYGTLNGIIMFKDLIENLTFEEQNVAKLGFERTGGSIEPLEKLGDLENSEVLIKYFNKSIDVINELFDKYDQLEEFVSSTIVLAILIGDQSEHLPNSNIRPGVTPATCCYISKNKDSVVFTLHFQDNDNHNKLAMCNTTTKFDETSVIYTTINH